MALKVEAKGGKGGNQWDDGSDYHDVTKIHVRGGVEGVQFIKFEYVKAGKTTVGPIHGVSSRGFTQTFEVYNLEKEYLLSVEGYYNDSTGVIQSLQFITNKKTSDVIGYNEGAKFSLRASRSKIIGFHGFADKNLNSLGAYFIRMPSIKAAIQGGQTTGKGFDDGGDNEGIRKVYVTSDGSAIRHVRFDYDKAGQVETRERGEKIGTQHEFTVNHPYEYITSVEGTYANTKPYNCVVLTSLTFKTSKGRSSPIIGKVTGTKFVLQNEGNAIVGFHGRVGSCVDGIGAYYSSLPPSPPLEAQSSDGAPFIRNPALKSAIEGGQTSGKGFDDGGDYDGIRKVLVTTDGYAIRHVRFDYDIAGQVDTRERGEKIGTQYEFAVDHPYDEYITSVEGTYAHTKPYNCVVLTSLTFKTSKGRVSPTIGKVTGTKFKLERQGDAIVGFHGRVGSCVDGIGAYYAALPRSPPPAEKLQGQGGEGGDSWDDGAFQNVKKIYIGQGDVGIAFVKFEYENYSEVIVGEEHGKKTLLGYEEFVLDYPSEYITDVEGFHDKVLGAETGVITMLRFKTNKRTSPPFGLESANSFILGKEGHKIVGFHGKASTLLHQIGVHVSAIV